MIFRVDVTAEVAKTCFKDFKPQERKNFISQQFENTLWVFAALGHESPDFFDADVDVAIARLNN
eukprot:7129983-Karenia_brevis.AAC.1